MSDLIPYNIYYNGQAFIGYRKRQNPLYITVSANGIANGKSDKVNDGADFGPDTSGTTTLGVQEAFNYAVENAYVPEHSANIYAARNPTAVPMYFTGGFEPPSGRISINVPVISGSSASGGIYNGTLPTFYIKGFASGLYAQTLLINYDITFGNTNSTMVNGGLYIGNINFLGCNLYFPGSFSADPNIIFDTVGGGNNNIMMTGGGIAQLTLRNVFNFNGRMFVHGGYQITALNSTIKNGLFLSDVNQIGGVTLDEAIGITAGNPIFNLNTWEIDDNQGVGTPIINNTAGGTTSKAYFEVGTCILTAGSSSSYKPFFANTLQSSYPNVSGFDSTTQGNLEVYMHIHKLQLDGYTDFTLPSGITVKEFTVDEIINNSGQDISTYLGLERQISTALAANPPVIGTAYQNTHPFAIEIELPVWASSSTANGTVVYAVANAADTLSNNLLFNFVSESTTSDSYQVLIMYVPAGWYYEIEDNSSGITLGRASVYAM